MTEDNCQIPPLTASAWKFLKMAQRACQTKADSSATQNKPALPPDANQQTVAETYLPPAPSHPESTSLTSYTSVTTRLAEPPAPTVAVNLLDTLTACLDHQPFPKTAKRIARVLFELGVRTLRERQLSPLTSVAVFHLPLELLAAALGVCRETVWRNLKPLKAAGLIDARDHFSTLRGQTSVSGKIWAVSMRPGHQLSGRAEAVRVKLADLKFPWRDLDADVVNGRTAYALTRSEEQQLHDTRRCGERAPLRAEARKRATTRKTERKAGIRAGKKPLRGRQAATANAAETRAAHPPVQKVQQSNKKTLKPVKLEELRAWALAPFFPQDNNVDLTVALAQAPGLEVIYDLPLLAKLPLDQRGQAVERTARGLAFLFEDTKNLRFWYWLLWQLTRATEQYRGCTAEVQRILTSTYRDIQGDEGVRARMVKPLGALVAAALRQSGVLDALRQLAPTQVGVKPAA